MFFLFEFTCKGCEIRIIREAIFASRLFIFVMLLLLLFRTFMTIFFQFLIRFTLLLLQRFQISLSEI